MTFLARWQRARMACNSRRKIYPPRVADGEAHWTDPPPVVSYRCRHWLARIAAGWRPGRFVSRLGYYCAAEFYGVYIWEYLNLIVPALHDWAPKEWMVNEEGAPVRL